MDGAGKYATRLRVAQQVGENGSVMPGKRSMRQSQKTGNVAKRALGDITNNAGLGGCGMDARKKVVPAQEKRANPQQRQPLQLSQHENVVDGHVTRSATMSNLPSSRVPEPVSKGVAAPQARKPRVAEPAAQHPKLRRSRTTGTSELNTKMAGIQLRKPEVVDIDAQDFGDHLACPELVNEIYQNWRLVEHKHLPQSEYMSLQEDISDKMRSILIDWLVDVHQKFKLSADTLYLSVNVIDRFLSVEKVVRQKLQLVGVTSMLIACKYHEIYAPETNDFVYISDQAYTREEILRMEAAVLNRLGFNVTMPSPLVFLSRCLKAAGANKRVSSYASFCLELMQQEYRFVGVKPSKLAAACCLLAGMQCDPAFVWDETLEHYAGFSEAELLETVEKMYLTIQSNSSNTKLTAVRRKYSQLKYHEVAKMPLKPMDFSGVRCTE